MHRLLPFENSQHSDPFHVSAKMTIDSDGVGITLDFQVDGPIKNLKLPPLDKACLRADNLWQSTCFEAFLSITQNPDSPYFEVNIAPDGRWNLYQLTSYRQNLLPVANIPMPAIQVDASELTYKLQARWQHLSPEVFNHSFHVGLTVILESQKGEKSYWALAHKSPQADFHNKASFTVIV